MEKIDLALRSSWGFACSDRRRCPTLRRFTVRYVQDPSHRRMVLPAQRLLLWFGIIVVVALAFASDICSLATFLGPLTAGIAVALQNVILVALGYFLLVGKLGIRVGDRVQFSGGTGELIELGLLQFQIKEMDAQEQPTGRVCVVFKFVRVCFTSYRHVQSQPTVSC